MIVLFPFRVFSLFQVDFWDVGGWHVFSRPWAVWKFWKRTMSRLISLEVSEMSKLLKQSNHMYTYIYIYRDIYICVYIYIYMYIYIYISRDRVTLGCIVRWAPLEKLIHAPRQGDRRLASWRHTLHSWYEKTEGGVPGEIPGDLQKKRRRTTQDS